MLHEKWKLNNTAYSRIDISRNKDYYSNVVIVSNIFSKKFVSIYFDKAVKIDEIQHIKTMDNPFKLVDTEEGSFVFTKSYLSSIKKEKFVDLNKALAEFDLICVDDKKNKYVSYIIYNEDMINETFASSIAKKNIEGLIKSKTAQQINKMVTIMVAMNMVRRTQHLRTISSINSIGRF